MNHSFNHILHKPWMKDPISGLSDPFVTSGNGALFTSVAARSAVPEWMHTDPVTGADITAKKQWTRPIGASYCAEQITGSMAYLTQTAVSSILPSLSSRALFPGTVNGIEACHATNSNKYGLANELKLNSGALTAFTAGSAALIGCEPLLQYASLSGRSALSDIVMHDYISVTPKTSEFTLTYGMAAQTGLLHNNPNLNGNTSFAFSKYGAVGAVIQDPISVNTKTTIDQSYVYGITDPMASIRTAGDLYTSSFLTGSNGYAHMLKGAGGANAVNAWKVNTNYDLGVNASSYLLTGEKKYVHSFSATGAVMDHNVWKVNTHHDLYPASLRVTTEPNYLTTLGSGVVYTNHLHNNYLHGTDYGVTTALKATQWNSVMAVTAGVASAIALNRMVSPYALSVDYPLKSLSIPLGVAGIYATGDSLTAALTTDAYKMVTGAGVIWKNGALSLASEGWTTKNIGIYHDYYNPSRSHEIVLPSYSEPTITEEIEIKYTLKSRLSVLNSSLAVSYQGAAEALNDKRSDHIRQACISMRQLLDFFVTQFFTIEQFKQWGNYREEFLRRDPEGNVTGVQRKAAYQFVTRMLASAPDPKKFLELMNKCNGGCHRFDENYSFPETVELFHKCEAMLEVLLNATDVASN